MNKRHFLTSMRSVGTLAALLLFSGSANSKGHGIRIGQDSHSAFHFDLDAGIGYSSNPFSIEWGKEAYGDILLKLKPGFSFLNENDKVTMGFGFNLDWTGLPDVAHNSANPEWRIYQGAANANAEFNRNGAVSAYIKDFMNMTRKTSELFVRMSLQINNTTIVGMSIRPSDYLTLDLDGQFGFSYWPPESLVGSQGNPDTTNFNTDNYYGHGRLSWLAAPKTTVYLDGKGGAFTYKAQPEVNATPLWVRIGANSELTDKFTGRISIGYANPLIRWVQSQELMSSGYMGLIFELGGTWTYGERSNLSFTFLRDMSPVPAFLSVAPLSGEFKLEHWFGEVVSMNLGTKLDYSEFGLPVEERRLPSGKLNRNDLTWTADAGLTWHIKEWVGITISNATTLRYSDAQSVVVNEQNPNSLLGTGVLKMSFVKNDTLLMLGIHY